MRTQREHRNYETCNLQPVIYNKRYCKEGPLDLELISII